MPIFFAEIPYDLQLQITKKFDHLSYANFKRSSICANAASEAIKTRIFIRRGKRLWRQVLLLKNPDGGTPYITLNGKKYLRGNFEKLSLSFTSEVICIGSPLTEQFCQDLINLFKDTGSKAEEVAFDPHCFTVRCSPDALNELLETAGVHSFRYCRQWRRYQEQLSTEYFRIPAMKEMKKIFAISSPLNDQAILALKAENLFLEEPNDFTGKGINTYVKEYFEGTRSIKNVIVHLWRHPAVWDVFEGLEYKCTSESASGSVVEVTNSVKKLYLSFDKYRNVKISTSELIM